MDDVSVPVSELEVTPPTRPRGRRTYLTIGALVALAALISATTIAVSGSSSPSVAATLQAAPATTRSAGSAQVTSRISMTINGKTQAISTVVQTADFRTGDSTLTLTSPDGVNEEVRIIHGVEYVSNPMFELPDGAHWIRITKADLGVGKTSSAGLGSGDPSSGLDFLSAKSGNPVVVGHTTIDGDETTHYKLTVDFAAYAALLGKATSKLGVSQLAQGLNALKGLVDLHHIPAEVWIDSAHRVRRFNYELSLNGHGVKVLEHDDTEFSNFGVAVHVSAPDTDDVVPLSDAGSAFESLANADSIPA